MKLVNLIEDIRDRYHKKFVNSEPMSLARRKEKSMLLKESVMLVVKSLLPIISKE